MAIISSKSIRRKMVNESWLNEVDSVIFENDLFTLGPYKMTSLPPYQDKTEEQIHCVPKGAAKKYNIHIRYDYETLDPKEIKSKKEFKCRYRPETVRVTWQTVGFRCSPDMVREFIDALDGALEFSEKVKRYLEQREKDIDNEIDTSDDDEPTIEIQ